MPAPLYIVDGSSYIFRAYYAIRSLSNSKGLPTNAIYGFTQMLLKLIADEKPEHLVMVFDTDKPSFRKTTYEAYKANRSAPPEDLKPQFSYIRDVTRALNICCLELEGFEADDIIATIVKRHLPKDGTAVIVTGDKDLMQLVDERVSLLDTMKDQRTGIAGVQEKFGVAPAQVRDVLALMGDTSDNIPGVPGIGPKSASQLIQQYGSLENLYEKLGEITGKKNELLAQHRDQAFLSRELATLHEDVPLTVAFPDFLKREPDAEKCQKLFSELEFHQLLKSFGEAPKPVLSRVQYHLVQDENAWQDFLAKLRASAEFAFDTETTSLNAFKAELVGISVALAVGEAYYLPCGHVGSETQLSREKILQDLKPIFEDEKIGKHAQNFKYDATILENYGIRVRGLKCDTMLASYLLDPASSNKLDSLALQFLQHKMISYAEVTQKKTGGLFEQVSLEAARDYSCEDADVTWQLSRILLPKLEEQGLSKLLFELEQPLTEVLMKMERCGIKVDVEFLKELQRDFSERMVAKEAEIYRLAGETFNIQSPKQLGEILFQKLNLPIQKKTKTGYSTDVEVLTTLAKLHELPKEILDFRGLAKLKSTYVDALLGLGDSETRRVHTSFNQTVAETGRLSSSDPNLQNIPIRSEDGAKIRRAFIAEPGFVLMSADYSQIELRILAQLSGDAALLQAFREGQDIHRLTAAQAFQVAESEVTSAQRAAGKTINFAVVYGQSPFGLSGQLGVSQKEAKQYIDNYFAKYQGVRDYRERVLAEARKTYEVRTLFGRRRFVPDIGSKNFALRGVSERIAFNTVIQGTAADVIKKAMLEIQEFLERENFRSRLLLQVHDELLFEAAEGELEALRPRVKRAMEQVLGSELPLLVEVGTGNNWAEAH